jgi:hypothetical protein
MRDRFIIDQAGRAVLHHKGRCVHHVSKTLCTFIVLSIARYRGAAPSASGRV